MTTLINRRTVLAGATGVLATQLFNTTHAAETPMKLGKDATPRQVAESYWRAECAHDIEAVGQHYHPDAVFMPPGEHLVGWDNIRKWYEASFKAFPGLEVEIVHEISRGNEASLEWKAVLTDPTGKRHPLKGMNIIRIEDGKYREVRPYFDTSQVKLGQ